jgi:DNA-directed RNA polymerase specialized sigma24 family protein
VADAMSQDCLPIVEALLDDANSLVKKLHLPSGQQCAYDDIVQDTMIVALRNLDLLGGLASD